MTVKVADFSDDRSGAILWDSESSADSLDLASVPLHLNGFDEKVADSTSVLVEVEGKRRDGRIGTSSVVFELDEAPTIESNQWLSSTQEIVDEQDLTARQCTKD